MKAMTAPQIARPQAAAMPAWLESLAVIMALPLLLVVGLVIFLAVRLSSRGPVFLSRTLQGKDGAPIKEYRFRCVYMDATQRQWKAQISGETLTRDPRVTAVGAILLSSGLNKLPRLLNVLKGELHLDAKNF